jgi:hypothetical protein
MIFWILLGLTIAAAITVFILRRLDGWDDLGDSIFLTALTALGGALIGLILMLVLSIWFGPVFQFKGEADHQLVALKTSNSVEGRFFLGSGYVNGQRTLNYITDDDGAFRIESADAAQSVVYQDSDEPTVTVHEWNLENPWFAPWSFGHWHTYTFHVPEGSILSDYTIDNG